MFLKSLSLQDFRSFKKTELSFSSRVSCLIGQNASGKTNILEAIYLLATGRSFRARREEEMIRNGEELGRIESCIFPHALENLSQASPHHQLEIILTKGEVGGKGTARKIYKVNGVGKRWKDFCGNLPCVIFRPEDIDLILGSPSVRRNYLDTVLEQVDWQYKACNLVYQKGLRQRNKLLLRIRENQAHASQLIFWNQLLIKNGNIITLKRQALLDFLNQNFLDNQENLEIIYDKSLISEERLTKYHQAELALGMTLVGPHRDDIKLIAKSLKLKANRDLSLFGSRGEQRMAVLNLKRAEQEFIEQKTQIKPILLLDDIFSELDKENSNLVIEVIRAGQVIITSTEIEESLDKKNTKFLKIENLF